MTTDMNDLASLLQQVNDMNASWLQVAVSAQSAFDTIDAAAIVSLSNVFGVTDAVNRLNDNLIITNAGRVISIDTKSVNAANAQIVSLQNQINNLSKGVDVNINVRQPVITAAVPVIDANEKVTDAKKPEESEGIGTKVVKSLIKSVAKTGTQTLLKKVGAQRLLPKALRTVAGEATEAGGGFFSKLGGNAVDGLLDVGAEESGSFLTSILSDVGIGDLAATGLGTLFEGAATAFAPEIVLPVMAGGYLLKKWWDSSKEKDSETNVSDSSPAEVNISSMADIYQPKYLDNTGPFATPTLAPISPFIPPANLVPNTQGMALLTKGAEPILPQGNPYNSSLPIGLMQNESPDINGSPAYNGNANNNYNANDAAGKKVEINVNKSFIDGFTINVQNMQEGYDTLRSKVEQILLEILNGANATQN